MENGETSQWSIMRGRDIDRFMYIIMIYIYIYIKVYIYI